jgi:hypothetical protein
MALASFGRSSRAPDWSNSSKICPTRARRMAMQRSMFSRWSEGEMKLSPSRPRTWETRT